MDIIALILAGLALLVAVGSYLLHRAVYGRLMRNLVDREVKHQADLAAIEASLDELSGHLVPRRPTDVVRERLPIGRD